MVRTRSPILGLVASAGMLAACTASAPPPDPQTATSTAQPSALETREGDAEPEPAAGSLRAGQVYVTETDPPVQFTVDDGWTAIPSAGGVGLLRGGVRAWIITAPQRAYVGLGDLVAAGTSASDLADQLGRNRRLKVSEPRPTELGGATGFELDATVPYDLNTEGGGPVLDTAGGTLLLPDLTRSRIYLLDVDGAVVAVVVSGPEEMAVEEVVDEAGVLLESVTFS